MSSVFQIGIAVASVLVLLGLMAVVRSRARAYGLSAEVQRKLVHIGTGLYALTLPWLFPDRWPVYMLIALTLIVMAVLRLPRFARGGIGETLHGVERRSYGDILLALAIGVVFLLSEGEAVLYVLPIAILTLADAAAALTGSRYGRGFFQVEDGQKSIEGSVAFFMTSLILSMICLLLLSDVARPNVILLSVIVAAFGTLVEADSWRGFDNFFLPAGLMVFLQSHLDSSPGEILFIMAVFVAAIWVFLSAAAYLGLSLHAARVYVIAIFLLLSVVALQNTVLPVLVFVAHALSRRLNPCDASYPELDIVAGVALVSFGWLSVGLLADHNALLFYGLTQLGLITGLIVLSCVVLPPVSRWVAISAAVLVLFWLYAWLMEFNPVLTKGTTVIWPLMVATVVLSLAATATKPTVFASARVAKLTLMSLIVPVVGYLWAVGVAKGWIG
ncbi:MAG: hypothetical protein WBN04_09885 [Paracoccaceae bacterium]